MALTDPARELVFTLEQLADLHNQKLDRKIAQVAKVEEWSADFFKVIFYLIDRFDLLAREIEELDLDDDIKDDALRSIATMRSVFSSKSMLSQTTEQTNPRITGANATVLKMLSAQVRKRVFWHKLSNEERDSVLHDVDTLVSWLSDFQTEEKDFIRQALIDGLKEFRFRLERLHWFGSGYPIESLREVIHAYLALEGARSLSGEDEISSAILKRTSGFLKKIFDIIDVAKDNTERADWILRAYGAVSALSDGTATISGLLGSPTGNC
ncbi:hypothetical protein GCM10009424_35110 [Sphingomonas ursincola]|uniref:Uncharacterized protein n=1 Tax=Sphingomonas ursincola TaxID=56361 RepID=A0A7V8U7A2_9SPHN|nr:hypothetical protein [Sphingomonas ursincola]MBA1372758.1 hypothetical protein [Sphingomonas ursincola]